MTREEVDAVRSKHRAILDTEMEKSISSNGVAASAVYKPLSRTWKDMDWPTVARSSGSETGVDIETLTKVGGASVGIPEGFVSFFFLDPLLVVIPD